MRAWIRLGLIFCVAFIPQYTVAIGIEELLLTPSEVPPSCRIISGAHPARNPVQVFYDHGIHSEMLPLVLNKRLESFKCGKQKGTLYLFEYTTVAQRENAEVFARTSLWDSEEKVSSEHSEQIFHWDRYLMILSFKDFQRDLLGALHAKIKRIPGNNPGIR